MLAVRQLWKKNDGREYDVKCKGVGVLLINERFVNISEEATWICIVFVCHKCVKEREDYVLIWRFSVEG